MRSDLTVIESVREFPAIFPGNDTPQVRARVQTFYLSIAAMFERWLQRSGNKNTQRSYREAVEGFIAFMGIRWPDEEWQRLQPPFGLTLHVVKVRRRHDRARMIQPDALFMSGMMRI